MNALSDATGVAGSTATRMVDQLVRNDSSTASTTLTIAVRSGGAHPPGPGAAERAGGRDAHLLQGCVRRGFETERPSFIRVLELITGCLSTALKTQGRSCKPS